MIERYSPDFTASLAEQGKYLPKYVALEFDEYLRCGRLEHGFMLVVCGDCKHDKLVAFSCKHRGANSCGALCHAPGPTTRAEAYALANTVLTVKRSVINCILTAYFLVVSSFLTAISNASYRSCLHSFSRTPDMIFRWRPVILQRALRE